MNTALTMREILLVLEDQGGGVYKVELQRTVPVTESTNGWASTGRGG